ncbi:MAG TPA: hypothetical protein VJ866_19600 [Pyrinomonadaceae bacterium]|nr:hypothetical protein [Pyrinomonadaceae bacterium]
MSQNIPGNEGNFGGGTGSGGSSAGTGSGGASGGTGSGGGTGLSTTGGSGGGTGTGTATAPAGGGIGAKAKEYGQTVADAASTARDYLSDKASVVGDKLQDLRNVDYAEYANQAKDYARQNPGQALLVAAAAGFVIGLLVRGGRR